MQLQLASLTCGAAAASAAPAEPLWRIHFLSEPEKANRQTKQQEVYCCSLSFQQRTCLQTASTTTCANCDWRYPTLLIIRLSTRTSYRFFAQAPVLVLVLTAPARSGSTGMCTRAEGSGHRAPRYFLFIVQFFHRVIVYNRRS